MSPTEQRRYFKGILENQKEIKGSLETLSEEIYGNGSPGGLKVEVASIKVQIESLDKRLGFMEGSRGTPSDESKQQKIRLENHLKDHEKQEVQGLAKKSSVTSLQAAMIGAASGLLGAIIGATATVLAG